MLALHRFRLPSLRWGLLLAFAAWFMQLSVFLTPILADQISIGYGVCKELAVISTTIDRMPQMNRAHHAELMPLADHSTMDMHSQHPMPTATSTQDTHSNNASSNNASDHGSYHGQCNFCLLFGHSVLPPFVTIALSLAPVAFTVSVVKSQLLKFLFITQNKTLHPQSRAPPVFIL